MNKIPSGYNTSGSPALNSQKTIELQEIVLVHAKTFENKTSRWLLKFDSCENLSKLLETHMTKF